MTLQLFTVWCLLHEQNIQFEQASSEKRMSWCILLEDMSPREFILLSTMGSGGVQDLDKSWLSLIMRQCVGQLFRIVRSWLQTNRSSIQVGASQGPPVEVIVATYFGPHPGVIGWFTCAQMNLTRDTTAPGFATTGPKMLGVNSPLV